MCARPASRGRVSPLALPERCLCSHMHAANLCTSADITCASAAFWRIFIQKATRNDTCFYSKTQNSCAAHTHTHTGLCSCSCRWFSARTHTRKYKTHPSGSMHCNMCTSMSLISHASHEVHMYPSLPTSPRLPWQLERRRGSKKKKKAMAGTCK